MVHGLRNLPDTPRKEEPSRVHRNPSDVREIERLHQREDELEAHIAALESMCRLAGYSEEQIKYGTPYIESMGT